MKKIFLPCNQSQANKELDCYGYLLNKGIELFLQGDFDKAAAYHENIARSLKELGRMKKEKDVTDKTWFLLKQIDSERQQKELLYNMKVNIYE